MYYDCNVADLSSISQPCSSYLNISYHQGLRYNQLKTSPIELLQNHVHMDLLHHVITLRLPTRHSSWLSRITGMVRNQGRTFWEITDLRFRDGLFYILYRPTFLVTRRRCVIVVVIITIIVMGDYGSLYHKQKIYNAQYTRKVLRLTHRFCCFSRYIIIIMFILQMGP